MYPAATPAVREAINLRYRLLPYFYTLLWQACADDEPMLRPTFLDREQDARTFGENDDFLIGRDLLVASVVEPGQRRRSVYLPDNGEGWYCFYSGQWFGGGQTVTLAAALERLPLLVRAGRRCRCRSGWRMWMWPPTIGVSCGCFRSRAAAQATGCCLRTTVKVKAGGRAMRCGCTGKCAATISASCWISRRKGVSARRRTLALSLPEGETRALWVNGEPGERFTLE